MIDEGKLDIYQTRIPDSDKKLIDLSTTGLMEIYLPLMYEITDLHLLVSEAEIKAHPKTLTRLKKALREHIKHTKMLIDQAGIASKEYQVKMNTNREFRDNASKYASLHKKETGQNEEFL